MRPTVGILVLLAAVYAAFEPSQFFTRVVPALVFPFAAYSYGGALGKRLRREDFSQHAVDAGAAIGAAYLLVAAFISGGAHVLPININAAPLTISIVGLAFGLLLCFVPLLYAYARTLIA